MAALELVESSAEKRETLKANTALFHSLMTEAGFELLPGTHPIRPVMFPGEDGARQAAQIADHMLGNGVYVIAFSFPVVPRGQGAHPRAALGRALRGRRARLRRRLRRRPGRRRLSRRCGQPVGRSRSQGRVRSKRRPEISSTSMATTMDFGVSTHGRTGRRSTT